MSRQGILLFALVCCTGSSAHDLSSCMTVLGGSSLLQMMMSHKAEQIGPDVYRGVGRFEVAEDHEVATAKKLSAALRLPVMLASEMRIRWYLSDKLISIPAFDGVVFDPSGSPLSNLSLKSSKGPAREIMRSMLGTIQGAIQKIEKYSQVAEWEQYLAGYESRGLKDALNLFGLTKGGLVRPAVICLDYSKNPDKHLTFDGHWFALRADDEDEATVPSIAVEAFRNVMRDHPLLQAVVILVEDQAFYVDLHTAVVRPL